MPCYDGRDSSADVNNLTSMLCEACGIIEDLGVPITPTNELGKWWTEHKKKDTARRDKQIEEMHKQRIRSEALGKLTLEERRALGIKDV